MPDETPWIEVETLDPLDRAMLRNSEIKAGRIERRTLDERRRTRVGHSRAHQDLVMREVVQHHGATMLTTSSVEPGGE